MPTPTKSTRAKAPVKPVQTDTSTDVPVQEQDAEALAIQKEKDEIAAQKAELAEMMAQFKAMQKEAATKEAATSAEKSETAPLKKRIQIDRNEMIKVVSMYQGSLTYKSQKTGLSTHWDSYGSEEWIDFGELLTMKASQPTFLTNTWLFIEDDNVVDYLGLRKTYENIIPVGELENFFTLDHKEIGRRLDFIPRGTRELIVTKALQLMKSGQLFDNRIISTIETKLKVELSALMNQ